MNKRIKELAEQANANKLSYAYYRGEKKPENAVTLHSVDLEKFAQLIVQECAKVNNQFIGRRIGEIDLDMVYKEHFGVKV